MRNILVIVIIGLIATSAIAQYSYKRLSGKERSQFEQTYLDLKKVYAENNIKVFAQFAPVAVTEYRNILLDPKSEYLRAKYLEIDSLLQIVNNEFVYEKALLKIDTSGMSVLQQLDWKINQCAIYYSDSVPYYKEVLATKVHALMTQNPSLENYSLIQSLSNADDQLKTFAHAQVEEKLQDKFVELSAQMNYDDLLAFQKQYRTVFAEDISVLLEKSRQKERLSLLKKPDFDRYDRYTIRFGNDADLKNVLRKKYRLYLTDSLDMPIFERYYRLFPEDDFELFTSIEDRLYQACVSTRDPVHSMDYLKYYPSGRYVTQVSRLLSEITQSKIIEPDTTVLSVLH